MSRRVVVLKDSSSPLWFVRCAAPCKASRFDQEWCSDGSGLYGPGPARGYERGVCWLFSSTQKSVCEAYAASCGWELVQDDAKRA